MRGADPVDGALADPENRGSIGFLPGLVQREPDLTLVQLARPASDHATRLCSSQAGVYAIHDQFALELRNGAQDVQDQPARGARSVDRLRQRFEGNARFLQVANQVDQSLQAASGTAQAIDAEAIARFELLQRLAEPWAVLLGSGNAVIREYLLAAGSAQCVHLGVEILVCGRDPRVSNHRHFRTPFVTEFWHLSKCRQVALCQKL